MYAICLMKPSKNLKQVFDIFTHTSNTLSLNLRNYIQVRIQQFEFIKNSQRIQKEFCLNKVCKIPWRGSGVSFTNLLPGVHPNPHKVSSLSFGTLLLKKFFSLSKRENKELLNKALFSLPIFFYQACYYLGLFFQTFIPNTGSLLQLDFAHLHKTMTCCHGNYYCVTNENLCLCGREQYSNLAKRKYLKLEIDTK